MLVRLLGVAAVLCLGVSGEDALPRLLEQYRSGARSAVLCDRIGIAYTRTGELKPAEEFFRKALQLNPALVSARKNLGTVLWFQNRRKESALEFQRVAAVAPNDPVMHLYLGLSAYDRKDFDMAAVHFEGAGTLASANPEVIPLLAEACLKSGRSSDVIRVLEPTLQSSHGDLRSWIQLGQAYDRAGRAQDAYQAFQRAIEMEPGSEEGYLVLADFAAAHGNRTFARETLQRAIRANPESTNLVVQSGVQSALDGNFDEAAKSFRAAQQLTPNSPLPLLALGVTQLQSGKWEEAAESFRTAESMDSKDFREPFLYATALSQSQSAGDKNIKDSIQAALKRAIALNPRHAGSRVALAQQLLGEGMPSAANAELQAALAIDPSNAAALYQLGLFYQRQGQPAKAELTMKRFRIAKAQTREDQNQLIQILKTVK